MKFALIALFFSLMFWSCQADGCVTCEKQLPNSVITQELCQDGANVNVRITLIGIGSDSTVTNSTVDAYQSKLIGEGYSCK